MEEEKEDAWPEANGECDDNWLKDVELPAKEQQNTHSHHYRENNNFLQIYQWQQIVTCCQYIKK